MRAEWRLLLGRPKPLEGLVKSMVNTIVTERTDEKTDFYTSRHDQSALHKVYLDGGGIMRVDHSSDIVLNLHACTTRQNYTRLVKGFRLLQREVPRPAWCDKGRRQRDGAAPLAKGEAAARQ